MKLLSYALTIWYTFVKMCHLPHKKNFLTPTVGMAYNHVTSFKKIFGGVINNFVTAEAIHLKIGTTLDN